jgi:2-polyprenyl-3-methyl-5-hydroxy-6-metoxy-1,4-benzoquinol methylase
MADYRKIMYNHYVTKFKREKSYPNLKHRETYFLWCKFKIMPFLQGLDYESNILELGCGPGHMIEFLEKQGFKKVSGIDISSEQVELAKERGVEAEIADALRFLEGRQNTYDTIFALDFFEHFTKEEAVQLASLTFDSLAKGGKLILQTPNGQGLFPGQIIYGDITHLTIFTPTSLEQLLREAGYENFRFSESTPVPVTIKNKLSLFLWKIIKSFVNAIRRIETGKSQSIWTENMICYCEKTKD